MSLNPRAPRPSHSAAPFILLWLIRVQGYKILNKNLHKMVSNSDWNRRASAVVLRLFCGYSGNQPIAKPFLLWNIDTCFFSRGRGPLRVRVQNKLELE